MSALGYKVGSVEVIRDSGTTYRGCIRTPDGVTHVLEAGPELVTHAEACQAADAALRELFWRRGTPIPRERNFDTFTSN